MLTVCLLLAQVSVYAEPVDPFRRVAEEIATQEHTAVVSTLNDIRGDGFLVWVASPDRLSDASMIDFLTRWRDRFPGMAVGLITGRDADAARSLWQRSSKVRDGPAAAFQAMKGLTIDERLFMSALSNNSYVSFSGHGGPSYLRLSKAVTIDRDDIPNLNNLVVGTESCNVFRPWSNNSIALAFIDKGAAAFAGSVYSPLSTGYIPGATSGMPFLYTHPRFPLGRVVQLQSRGTLRAFASLPYYLLLGDPRIALLNQAPYTILSDEVRADQRVIRLTSVPQGSIPIRIAGGASYSFVAVASKEVTTEYPFYISAITAIDIAGDKYLLVEHEGGPLTMHLQRSATRSWSVRTYLSQSLDAILVRLSGTGEGVFLASVGVVGFLLKMRKRPRTRGLLIGAAVAACVTTTLHLAWTGFRGYAANAAVVSATFALTAFGTVAFLTSKTWTSRVAALGWAVAYAWLPVLFYFVAISLQNAVTFRPHLGVGLYNYNIALLGLGALGLSCAVLALIWAGLVFMIRRHGHPPGAHA